MKKLVLFLATVMCVSAQASDVQLYASINVEESTAVVGTNSAGSINDVDVYTSEDTYVIGKSTFNGISQQIVAKVVGCGLVKDRKDVLLRISNKPNKYNGYFGQSTYQMAHANREDCQMTQRQIRGASFDKVLNLKLDNAKKTFTIVVAPAAQ